jgi:cbb3-type cytochrome oxidase maturation protein
MNIVLLLAPFSLLLALVGLVAFWWTVRNGQYDDPQGDAARILIPETEDGPNG